MKQDAEAGDMRCDLQEMWSRLYLYVGMWGWLTGVRILVSALMWGRCIGLVYYDTILRYDTADKKTILPSIPILKTLILNAFSLCRFSWSVRATNALDRKHYYLLFKELVIGHVPRTCNLRTISFPDLQYKYIYCLHPQYERVFGVAPFIYFFFASMW
jgi:hypothetical protein